MNTTPKELIDGHVIVAGRDRGQETGNDIPLSRLAVGPTLPQRPAVGEERENKP